MPRVALFNTQFLPYSQTFVYEELRQHRRYSAEVFTRRRLLAERFPFAPVHVAEPLYGYTRSSARFDRLFRTQPYDLVHAHFGTGAIYAMRWAERFARPLVVSFHGHDVSLLTSYERFFPKHWRYASLHARMFRTLTLGLCASTELRDLLVTLGMPADKLRVHRLGIDLEAFARGTRDAHTTRVVMIGRFVEKKGFAYGMRAFAEAARTRPDLHLTLVGDGKLDAELRRLARTLGIEARVHFSGVLPKNEIARVLAESDVMLAPSVVSAGGDRDSGLIVVKEASASEVVPIGSMHGGIPEIIDHGVTGFLVPERDVVALAQRLAGIASDASLRQRMGRAARAKMEREYDNRQCVARLEEYYDEAIALHARASTAVRAD
jgi:colanic acid/amylovoran biosynthesis glycosyltransferase